MTQFQVCLLGIIQWLYLLDASVIPPTAVSSPATYLHIELRSVGLASDSYTPNGSYISINGTRYTAEDGLNVVAINYDTGSLVSFRNFKTYGPNASIAVRDMKQLLFDLPRRSLIFVVLHAMSSDAVNQLQSEMKELGAKDFKVDVETVCYCFAGYKGVENGRTKEQKRNYGFCARQVIYANPPDSAGDFDYSLAFTSRARQTYSQLLSPSLPSLERFTLCLWMQLYEALYDDGYWNTLVNYYNFDGPRNDEITLAYSFGQFKVIIGDDKASKQARHLNDGLWHHVCLVWCNEDGVFRVFLDGFEECSGETNRVGHSIAPNGEFFLGREQDCGSFRFTCMFDGPESFQGSISHLSMWSESLLAGDILAFFKEDTYLTGNILGWPDFKSSTVGGLKMVNISGQLRAAVPSPVGLFPLNGRFEANDASPNKLPAGLIVRANLTAGIHGEPNGSYVMDENSHVWTDNRGKLDLPNSATILLFMKVEYCKSSLLIWTNEQYSGKAVFGIGLKNTTNGTFLTYRKDNRDIKTDIAIEYQKWLYIGVIFSQASGFLYLWKEDHIAYEQRRYGEKVTIENMDLAIGWTPDPFLQYNIKIACVQIYNVSLNARQIDAARNTCANLAPVIPTTTFPTLPYKLVFPLKSTGDYVLIERHLNLSAFSVCYWKKTMVKYGTQDEILSVSKGGGDVISLRLKSGDRAIKVTVDRWKHSVNLPKPKNQWYHTCVTWEGQPAFYIDGALVKTMQVNQNFRLNFNATIVIGQDQDEPEGGFSKQQSFQGELADLNMWDYALNASVLSQMAALICDKPMVGNVFGWPDLLLNMIGKVRAELLGCQTASDDWSFWSAWSSCTMSCGNSGTKRGHRDCLTSCKGAPVRHSPCKRKPCIGKWSEWSIWSECDKSCGIGTKQRTRECQNPEDFCEGDNIELVLCNTYPCEGNWSEWSIWSECDKSCGNGTKQRTRECQDPDEFCEGYSMEQILCNTSYPCVGNWSEWSIWSECDKSCGIGTKQRTRECQNPEDFCEGDNIELVLCNTSYPCVGNWSEWSIWSECDKSCGNGTKQRTRECQDPDGFCEGYSMEQVLCNTSYPCVGNWSEWSIWSECDKSCGNGTKQRTRKCQNPEDFCEGDNVEQVLCNTSYPCVGKWSEWSIWSKCDKSCGNGTKHRVRRCIVGPSSCKGNDTDLISCNTRPCIGNWSEWSKWTPCDKSCGNGTRQRKRGCLGLAFCEGNKTEQVLCNVRACVDQSPWSSWSVCSRPCGNGTQQRARVNASRQIRSCNVHLCAAENFVIKAKLVNETWTSELLNIDSIPYKHLEEKIQSNVATFYQNEPAYDGTKLLSFKQGSVVTTFSIGIASVYFDQIVRIQDSMEKDLRISQLFLQPLSVTATQVPSAVPVILKAFNISATSIEVQWSHVIPKDPLTGYGVFYKQLSMDTWSSQRTCNECLSLRLNNLQEFTVYRIRVLATTDRGNGISSQAVEVRTDEGVPGRPLGLQAELLDADSVIVKWSDMPESRIKGILQGFRVYWRELGGKISSTVETVLPPTSRLITLRNLNPVTSYFIYVKAFNHKRSGWRASVIIKTLDTAPNTSPPNVTVYGMSHTTSLKVLWRALLSFHGNLLGYRVSYKIKSRAGSDVTGAEVKNTVVKPVEGGKDGKFSLVLHNLTSFSTYSVRVQAYNAIGDGPWSSDLLGETCRCPKDLFTNWATIPPYVNLSDNGQLGGIFGEIAQDMIQEACGVCENGHGRTTIHLKSNGKGELARKLNMVGVQNDIEDVPHVSFPVNGILGDQKYLKDYVFVPILASPGVAFITLRDTDSVSQSIIGSVWQCWPIVVMSMLLACLSGLFMWFAEKSWNPEKVPSSICRGVWDGLWWSFITMTTVGYGDRVPISPVGRVFSIFWILTGLILVSSFMSVVTTSLTSVTMETTTILYGTQVAAVQNSTEYRLGLMKNARMVSVKTVDDAIEALLDRSVRGILLDTYVAGSSKKLQASQSFRVSKIIERTTGYGLVLSGEAVVLKGPVNDYLTKHRAQLFKIVETNAKSLKQPPLSEAEEKSSNIFDSSSQLYRSALFIGLAVLASLVFCGALWDTFRFLKTKLRVGSETTDKSQQHSQLITNELMAMLQDFHAKYRDTDSRIRQNHALQLRICRLSQHSNDQLFIQRILVKPAEESPAELQKSN